MRRWPYGLTVLLILLGLLLSPVPTTARSADSAGKGTLASQALSSPLASGSNSVGCAVLEADSRHIVLEWTAPAYQVVEDAVDGRAVQRVVIPDCPSATAPGEPELPLCSAALGVPPDAALALRVVETESVSAGTGFHLPPQPDLVVEPDLRTELPVGVPMAEYHWAEGPVYESDDLFPSQVAALEQPAFLRHQQLVSISFSPLQYHPRSGELIYHPRVRLEVTFGEAHEPMGYVAEPAAFEQILAGHLLNYQQARGWRQTTVQALDVPPAPPDPGWRIPISQEGIYKLTYQRLQAAGLPVDTLDPRTLRLLRYGQEVAIRVPGEEDGHLDPVDYVLLHGQPLSGNRYSDAEIYWLTYGGEMGRRMATRDGTPDSSPVPTSFATVERLEQNRLYCSQMPWRADHDHWFWNYTYPEGNVRNQSYSFPAHALAPDAYTATLRLHLYSATSDEAVSPDHHIRVFVNNVQVSEMWWDGQVELTPTMHFSASLLQPGGNTVRVENPGDTGATVELIYYDWLDLEQRRLFTADADALNWPGAAGEWEYHLDGFTEPAVHLLDIRDPDGPVEIVSATVVPAGPTYSLHFADQVTVTTAYRAVAAGRVLEPAAITPAAPADLRDPGNGADYLVITHGDFYTQAQALAAFRAGQGLQAVVVNVQDVYDLFAYGRRVPEAVHDFLAYAYTYWNAPAPAYVVLLGDGHYDSKNYQGYGVGEYILPYLAFVDPWIGETAADNRYACLSGEDTVPDMHLGRLPANTAAQAQVMVDKIIAYESSPPAGEWRLRSLFVADNADDAGDFAALSDALIPAYYPSPYQAGRVYFGITHPYENPSVIAHNAIVTNTNAGQLLINYIGHGGPGLWASERLLNITQVGQLSNGPYYPVVTAMTCYEGYYIQPQADWRYYSLAETYLRASGKGWIASWSPTGLGVATGHHYLDEGFFQAVFLDDVRQLGPATLAGKLRLWASGASPDLLDTYLLFGDPALAMPLLETDLSLDKAAQQLEVPLQPGDPLTFTLSLAAAGPATAHHVVLTDTLSPYIVSPTVQAAGLTLTTRPGSRYVWDVADLPAGQAGTVTITAHLSWLAPAGPLVNQARVATSAQETDLQNNADLVTWLVIPGPPHQIAATADPPELPADGTSLSLVHAQVADTAGNPVADGTPVHFAADAGTFLDGSTRYTTTTSQGGAEVFLRASTDVVTATVTVTSGQAGTTVAVPFLPLAPYSIALQAVPNVIPLTGTAAITATVQDIFGHMVRDGTEVSFTTSLGTISPTVTATSAGLAHTTLHGTHRSGWATVVGRSGIASGFTVVRIGTGGDYTLTLAVDPPSLPADGQSQAVVTATLERVDGYPVTGTHWISFSTTLGAIPSRSLAVSGTAVVSLTAATAPGTATVSAWGEDASAQVRVAMVPGAPASLDLLANPTTIPVSGSSALLLATVLDPWGHPVADGTVVSFSTSLGTVFPPLGTTHGGEANAVLTSGTLAGTATVLAQAGPASDSAAVQFTALAPATVTLAVDPAVLYADGVASATVAAWLGDRFANPVQDGTAVQFYTDLGHVVPTSTATVQGWATAVLTGTDIGTATVRCFSGELEAQQSARFIPGPASTILVTASPGRLYANGTSTATVTAYVWDAAGHPVADGTAVSLGTTRGTITPTAALTQQGRVRAVLRTGQEPGWATVWAASGPAQGQTPVEFYAYRVYLPLVWRGE